MLIREFDAARGWNNGFHSCKRQNYMTDEHIARIIDTYRERPATPVERYARRVEMKEIAANGYNLNISRYVSIAQDEVEIDLRATHAELVRAERDSPPRQPGTTCS